MDLGSNHAKWEMVVNADTATVHKAFLDQIWWGPGGFPWYCFTSTSEIAAAKDEAGTGAIRQIPLCVREEIKSAEYGKFVEYAVVRRSIIPFSYHRGRVTFEPVEQETGVVQTKVMWEIAYTPKFFCGLLLRAMLAISVGHYFMNELKKACGRS